MKAGDRVRSKRWPHLGTGTLVFINEPYRPSYPRIFAVIHDNNLGRYDYYIEDGLLLVTPIEDLAFSTPAKEEL